MRTQLLASSFRFARSLPRRAKLALCAGFGIAATALIGAMTLNTGDFVAHEWGTFTSVQGSDGVLLDWRPLETSELPKFVYDWSKSGFNRNPFLGLSKGAMVTRQRMETPVIYFYAEDEQNVDVTVRFPQGLITEWYPQANQIGPAVVPPSPLVAKLDAGAHKVGAKPEFTFASLLPQHAARDSRIVWSNVKILPAKQHKDIGPLLPLDKSGSHYFAARETDAEFIRLNSFSSTNPLPEHEKFLFYRGAGNFATPLHVTMQDDNRLTLTNTGAQALPHLFVLRLREGLGQLVHLNRLAAGAEQSLEISGAGRPQEELAADIAGQMAAALTSEGLYPREAIAMVNTWKDSWFAEDGLRVLYLLPRAWTDQVLPLELNPRPRELVRVMVGRAEIINPALENRLREELTKAKNGDVQAHAQAIADLKKLGRFAEPAIRRITTGSADQQTTQFAWGLLQTAFKPSAVSVL